VGAKIEANNENWGPLRYYLLDGCPTSQNRG
jgi:hypothetical protein